MPSFMKNTAVRMGVMKHKDMFYGRINLDRKLPFTTTRDMAVVATRLLADRVWSGQKEVPVIGPEDLSFDDQAAIVSDWALGDRYV